MARSKSSITQHKKCRAFTLLEVLVALSIIAITLGAIIKTSSDQASNATYLKQKTLGHWVALNLHNQLLLSKEWPDIGKSSDSSSMANHDWHWRREISKTLSPDTRKIIYHVFSDNAYQSKVSQLTGYVTDPKLLYPGDSNAK
ncbi:MAG: type II secretion system minor pseudopilin GspI [Gammaproteobacteria bacterium]|nr:type II secretion system minor pseudopilin GspI [Gammaproteobacteria bacterium]